MTKRTMRFKRKARIRAKINGTSKRPRLSVYRSLKGMTVQIIDDQKGHTLVSKSIKGTNKIAAKSLGTDIAKLCIKKKITHVLFDRGGYRYHGAVAELAQAVREGGVTV